MGLSPGRNQGGHAVEHDLAEAIVIAGQVVDVGRGSGRSRTAGNGLAIGG